MEYDVIALYHKLTWYWHYCWCIECQESIFITDLQLLLHWFSM